MIHLNLKRNKEGLYIIDSAVLASVEKMVNTNPISGDVERHNFWIKKDGNKKVLVKYGWDESYLVSLYGELIFSKFAEKNGLPCANIDVAKYNKRYAVLSEDVCSESSERISCYQIMGGEGTMTVQSIVNAVREYVANLNRSGANIKIDPKLESDLKKLCLMDYMSYQVDRHGGNIMFEIINTQEGKTFRLCPAFDNEAVFFLAFIGTDLAYDRVKSAIITEAFSGDKGAQREFAKYIQKEALSLKDLYYPDLGMRTSLDEGDYPKEQKILEAKGYSMEQFLSEVALRDIIRAVSEDKELLEFLNNLTFDAPTYINEIEQETGFKIPEVIVYYAEALFEGRKKQVQSLIKKAEEQKGEDE